MKAKIIAITFLSSIATLKAQQTETRTVSSYNKIEVSDVMKVRYTNSDTLELKVVGAEDEIKNIETKVENNTLHISGKGNFKEGTTIYIKNNQLTSVLTSGASNFKTLNAIKADSIVLNSSGASSLNMKLDSRKTKIVLSGAASANLSGKTDDLATEVSGAASLKAYSLVSRTANVLTTGAAVARVNVSEKLNAGASGASSIKIKGDAKDINAETTSGASVIRVVDNSNNGSSAGQDSTTFTWKGKKNYCNKR